MDKRVMEFLEKFQENRTQKSLKKGPKKSFIKDGKLIKPQSQLSDRGRRVTYITR